MSIPIKLSNTSKMPGRSWSLQALDTCPGARDKTHPSGLVEACRTCYALGGNYRWANVKKVREINRESWKHTDFVPAMIDALKGQGFFRWFDSGDCYDPRLAHKLLEIMEALPTVQFWLPTRMHKFKKFADVFERMRALPNVVVRYSSDSAHGEWDPDIGPTSTIVQYAEDAPSEAFLCRAYEREGKCGDCRACWDKDVHLIAYPAHGQRAASFYKCA